MQETSSFATLHNFPRDYEELLAAIAPYYHDERPFDFFFEMYVLDVLEQLPSLTQELLTEFASRHPAFFETFQGDWRACVKGMVQLSDTIETAIWDLWIRSSEKAQRAGVQVDPWQFAQYFIEKYTVEDSKVDVWIGQSLERARLRVEAHRHATRH